YGDITGACDAMRDIFRKIDKVAGTDISVLVTGETGTGKELIARAIHRRSSRKDGPFIAINCGAIPENLLESELFGHEKGAFTGAHRQMKGKVEYAHGGTLCLEEIGEMPLGLQVKLPRFLQDGKLERVGGRESISVNTRILAATNANLAENIERRLFREDFFYRLSVVQIPVPALKERKEDIVLLAQVFLQRYRNALNARVTSLSEDAREAIRDYDWTGNVRDHEYSIMRAVNVDKIDV